MTQKLQMQLEGCDIGALFGNMDEHINHVCKAFAVSITTRDGVVTVVGEEANVAAARQVIESMCAILRKNGTLDDQNVRYCIDTASDGNTQINEVLDSDTVCISAKGRPIKAKTLGQKQYIKAIEKNSIVYGIGPAGTGKTYLAVAMAVKAFKAGDVEKIILTRPAVEAGEKLGFLPGDLQNKVDPYLRPLYDALFDMLGSESFYKYQERGNIEVAPLAYMRGRTLNDSFIILDEAQNTTAEQMKMFLTRLGFNSKAVITGDITQIDLPDTKKSGLVVSARIVRNVEGIEQIYFSEKDVVRHRLVRDIVKAYETYYSKRGQRK